MGTVDLGMLMLIVYMVTVWTVGVRLDLDRKYARQASTKLYVAEGLMLSGVILTLYMYGGVIWDTMVGN